MRLLLVKDNDKNFKLSKKALMLSSVSYAMPSGYVLGYLPKGILALLLHYGSC